MLKILHYSPALSTGGTARMAADTAAAMQLGGWAQNTVMAPGCGAVTSLAAYGVAYRRARTLRFGRYGAEALRLRHALQTLQPQAVLLYGLPATRTAWLATRRLPSGARPKLISVLTGGVGGFFAAASLRAADAVAVLSRRQRTLLQEAKLYTGEPPQKLWVVPYGVAEALFNPHYQASAEWRTAWQQRHPHFGRALSLCIPGAISPMRGLEQLPELLQQLKELGISPHFYIAGDRRPAPTAYLNRLQRLFAATGTEPHVTWADPQSGLREILSVCNITLSLSPLPATYDRCILEALSLGRPVVGFAHGHVGELLDCFLPEGCITPGRLADMADVISQWAIYPPDLPDTIPYPYRLTDTAATLCKLCTECGC